MRQLRRRLFGVIAFYKKFISDGSKITRPNFALLSPHRYSKKSIKWTRDADDAFQEEIYNLCSSATLALPVENAATYLDTDPSNVAAGAGLHQKIDGKLRLFALFQPSV